MKQNISLYIEKTNNKKIPPSAENMQRSVKILI